jgi:HD-GYP domain-containing protein (c-di-GMP phosphodiesterase class II)
MTTTRPYGEGIGQADALAELRRCAGRQFDPGVVPAFERVIARGRLGSLGQIAA